MPRRDRGFTLIELMAVLLILSVVLAAATLRVQGPLSQSRMANAVDKVSFFDAMARQYAVAQDVSLRMVFDLDEGTFYRTDAEGTERLGAAMALPAGFEIAKVRIGREEQTGTVEVPLSRKGFSPSYALMISGPDGATKWLLFAGLTDRMMELDDEKDVEAVLAKTSSGRYAR